MASPASISSVGRSTSSKECVMVESRKELFFFIAVGGLVVVAVVAVITRFV